jgi:hypothetical protein
MAVTAAQAMSFPTKDSKLNTLPLPRIHQYVVSFWPTPPITLS